MNREEQEKRYREAMAARRAGEVCPLCGDRHSALSPCLSSARPTTYHEPARLPPQARTTDPETSHAAAATDKRIIRLTCLGLYADAHAGLVDDDLALHAGFPSGHESYRRRGSDLRALGWTEWLLDSEGEPVRRKTSLGASARVSVITPLGRSVWEAYGS